ncbi:MAG: RluA family pseudouridine synthase [Candidatus Nealsonbacteria bacterium]|nr:RluA family pseudouridine synthase [Candidatus Nealsonbacteria bacterium]
MQNAKILYEDENIITYDKPAGLNSDDIPRRIHRLDKDTSGIFLVAKNDRTLEFLQKQFQGRTVEKKYIALVVGNVKNDKGIIETLLGRSPKDRRKQKVYFQGEPLSEGKREAKTLYKVLQKFQNYDLLEIEPKTGRKHQIRAHLAYLGHPIAGDKLYGFKNQPFPPGLCRQFLHASFLRIKLPSGEIKEFNSNLPEDLKLCLKTLKRL